MKGKAAFPRSRYRYSFHFVRFSHPFSQLIFFVRYSFNLFSTRKGPFSNEWKTCHLHITHGERVYGISFHFYRVASTQPFHFECHLGTHTKMPPVHVWHIFIVMFFLFNGHIYFEWMIRYSAPVWTKRLANQGFFSHFLHIEKYTVYFDFITMTNLRVTIIFIRH